MIPRAIAMLCCGAAFISIMAGAIVPGIALFTVAALVTAFFD